MDSERKFELGNNLYLDGQKEEISVLNENIVHKDQACLTYSPWATCGLTQICKLSQNVTKVTHGPFLAHSSRQC